MLAREGADIVLTDLDGAVETTPYPLATRDDLEQTAQEIRGLGRRVVARHADVRRQDELDAAVIAGIAELGGIDVVFANAGVWGVRPFWEISETEWAELQDITLAGVWRTAKAVAPHMIERGSGSIVITASINGLEPSAGSAHYVAAKHGVVGLMRNIALELAPHGIRCNAVCPGTIDTDITNSQVVRDLIAGGAGGTRAHVETVSAHMAALKGRNLLSPNAIAGAVLWLASDLASEVTGLTIPVDGGHMLLPGFNPLPAA
jgi:NAD(P)-dependent dehydrogenase (short-subunit alcohol dehydrogenase family)